VVSPHSPSTAPAGTHEFRERLRELGYVDGQNLALDTRWADDQPTRLPEIMADVVGRKPDVLVVWGAQAAIAASNATKSTPTVALGDLVGSGLAASLAQPGRNLTGLSLGYANIPEKWLELLKETVTRLSTVAVIANPDNPMNRRLSAALTRSASVQRLKVRIIEVRDNAALDSAFHEAARYAQAVVVLPDAVLNADRPRAIALAAKHRLPTMYSSRGLVEAGGFMAYGPDFAAQWRRAADYVDKILKGAKPADLPIEEPTEFDLAVNLSTARALHLAIPESVLLRANHVIR
jgi:putative ABC transport system substrate-binding protein